MSAELDQLVKILQSVLSDVAKHCLTSVISDRGSFERGSILGGLVSDKSNNHAVEVEEEHEQVKAKLEERFLLRCQCCALLRVKLGHIPSCEH